MRGWIAFGVLMLLTTSPSAGGAVDVVKPPKPPNFDRYAYHYDLLEQILEKTVGEYGPYIQQPYTEPLTTARVQREAVRGELINLLAIDFGNEIANLGMTPIPYPIDKGLLGYRVALIALDNQEKVDSVDSLAKLRQLTVGRGSDWGDVKIFEHNGVPVVTAPHYDSLFEMLARGRFDLFPRGVTEAAQELVIFRDRHPGLMIARRLLIKYPYAQFFYVSKSEPRLAGRLKSGLEKMLKDGSFDAVFNKHFAKTLADLKLADRVVVELENPFVPAWVPFDRKELWFDPRTAN
jgi:hypothetical protein